MEKPDTKDAQFYAAVDEAIAFSGPPGGRVTSEAFDAAAAHVASLLDDAAAAFTRGSFGTCVFLAITSLEETAKAELMGFRARVIKSAETTRRDPLRSHAKKHRIAVRPTTFMGRLPKTLGAAVCAKLQAEAESGGLVALRERALYVHEEKDGVTTPAHAISRERGREILLLALECADDVLVGVTNATYALGEGFEKLISQYEKDAAGAGEA